MSYRNLDKSDIWFILSPGRTGGKFLQTFIKNAYDYYNIQSKMFAYYKQNIDITQRKKIEPGIVYHTHDISDLNLINEKAIKVLNVRKPAETALSQCVALSTSIWHYYPRHKEEEKEIKSFKLDIDEYLLEYKRVKSFYQEIKPLLTEDTIIIDYDSYKQNTSYLFNILNIKPFDVSELVNKSEVPLPLKTKGSPETWFTNWEDIQRIIKELDNSIF
jgi:hypothetical protein